MGKNSEYLHYVSDLRDRTDIVKVIRGEGVKLKKRGTCEMVALSPFTWEKTPSFVVNMQKQIFKCFSSGKGGTVFSFLMYKRDVCFEEAVKILAKRYRFGYRKWRNEKRKKERIT